MAAGATSARLRWRCRRGMLELDALLLGFLDAGYDAADAELRRAFVDLVDLDDFAILDLVAGRAAPPTPAMGRLVARLAGLADGDRRPRDAA